jgi:hypothetical protein
MDEEHTSTGMCEGRATQEQLPRVPDWRFLPIWQGSGWPFLWFVSFGHAKEMIPTAVREPHQNKNLREAHTKPNRKKPHHDFSWQGFLKFPYR